MIRCMRAQPIGCSWLASSPVCLHGYVAERIAMPRHATPRVRVPLGSVGIMVCKPASTGKPGGWR